MSFKGKGRGETFKWPSFRCKFKASGFKKVVDEKTPLTPSGVTVEINNLFAKIGEIPAVAGATVAAKQKKKEEEGLMIELNNSATTDFLEWNKKFKDYLLKDVKDNPADAYKAACLYDDALVEMTKENGSTFKARRAIGALLNHIRKSSVSLETRVAAGGSLISFAACEGAAVLGLVIAGVFTGGVGLMLGGLIGIAVMGGAAVVSQIPLYPILSKLYNKSLNSEKNTRFKDAVEADEALDDFCDIASAYQKTLEF